MASLQPYITSILKSLPPSPIEQDVLDELVSRTLEDSKDKSSPENRRSHWEYLLKNEIFLLAETEGMALQKEGTKYYDELRDKLDLVLTFTAHDACEPTFPFIVLQDLLETQTIASCSHIFSWIEARAERLTEGLVPQKGKALILLRTLNDLLRRLSKMGSTTIFCGRILTFLSAVFPLGERSGVNLRGEYGPSWEGVKFPEKQKNDKDTDMKVDEPTAPLASKEDAIAIGDQMQVDSKKTPVPQTQTEKKEDFYNTFWSLQLPFSKPTTFANKGTFEEFKEAVNKVIPFIKEATAKERAMMGSRSSAGVSATLKRKREPEEETNSNEYFFAKFLTSPDLLDLEIADTHFRRQFLFQLLILLNHLLSFTKVAKTAWSTARNRSLQMEFTLEDQETQWVQETLTKVMEELRQTTPNGRTFADTVTVILEREKNWVKWKNELCTPFDKEPWSQDVDGREVGLLEATQGIRERLRESPQDWQWKLGTEPLTEIWEMGYTDLRDLQNPFQPGDVKDFVKKIKLEDGKIALRKKRLDRIGALAKAKAAAANRPPPPPPTIVVTPDVSSVKVELRPDPTPSTLAAPRPSTNSPLHPSLPPKPGSPSKPVSLPQEHPKVIPTTSNVAPALAPPPPVPAATPVSVPASTPVDDEIAKYEEASVNMTGIPSCRILTRLVFIQNKQRWAWLALRTARDQYLQYFGKIGNGDIELLAQEIENEKGSKCDDTVNGMNVEEHGPGSPSSGTTMTSSEGAHKDGEDIKMDDQ